MYIPISAPFYRSRESPNLAFATQSRLIGPPPTEHVSMQSALVSISSEKSPNVMPTSISNINCLPICITSYRLYNLKNRSFNHELKMSLFRVVDTLPVSNNEMRATSPEVAMPNTIPAMFHPFRRLPNEIRFKIWRTANLNFPRVIEIRPKTTSRHTVWRLQSSKPLTPLLAVNQDSRSEILPLYKHITSRNNSVPHDQVLPYSFLFNHSLDILFVDSMFSAKRNTISPPWSFEVFFGGNLAEMHENLQYLAGYRRFWRDMKIKTVAMGTSNWSLLSFKKLETCFMVIDNQQDYLNLPDSFRPVPGDNNGTFRFPTEKIKEGTKGAGLRTPQVVACAVVHGASRIPTSLEWVDKKWEYHEQGQIIWRE